MTTFLSRLAVHSKLFGLMLERCGIDPAGLAAERCGLSLAAAARACMACGRTVSCRRWLASSDPRSQSDPPPFCPNARRFAAFRKN